LNRVLALAVPMLCLGLAACGFRPMHASQSFGAAPVAADIVVAPIPDRLGQQVRNALIDQLTPRGLPARPAYELVVALSDEVEGYGFEPDREVTRERVRLTALYRLMDLTSGEAVLAGEARALVAYDVVQSDFAAFATRQDAREEAAQTLVADIVARIAAAELDARGP